MTADNHESGEPVQPSGPPANQPWTPPAPADQAEPPPGSPPPRARASAPPPPPPNRAGGSVYGTPVNRPAEPQAAPEPSAAPGGPGAPGSLGGPGGPGA